MKAVVFWLHHHDMENTAFKNCLLHIVLKISKRVFVTNRWSADFFSIGVVEERRNITVTPALPVALMTCQT